MASNDLSLRELRLFLSFRGGAPGVYGARMMGGGFGGCTINLVAKESVADVGAMVKKQYGKKFNRDPDLHVMSLSEGTNIVTESASIRFP